MLCGVSLGVLLNDVVLYVVLLYGVVAFVVVFVMV